MRQTWIAVAVAIAACGDAGGGDADRFPGLSADVEIVIDEMGVPHIYGATDADVFFAAGYQLATDRLFQLELNRRRALGRWSELLGASHYEDDRLARLFDWRDLGRADAQLLRADGGETYQAVRAYVAGINRRIDEVNRGEAPLPYGFGPGELDFRPERWALEDPLIIGRMILFANDNTVEEELFLTLLAKLQPEVFEAADLLTPMTPVFALPPEDRPPDGGGDGKPAPRLAPRVLGGAVGRSPEEIGAVLAAWHRSLGTLRVLGSNNWAVAGAHTASGRPIVANDPHQPIESPNLMYAMHLSSADAGGTLDVVGFGFAGMPGVQLGHNRDVVWAATTNFGDTMDVWEVDDLGDKVRVGGEEVAVIGRQEIIRVRGEGDAVGEGDELTFVAYDVPGLGVLLPDDLAPVRIASAGRTLLFRWVGFAPRDVSGLLDYDRATTLDEFDAAVDLLGAGFNFVASDGDSIGYHVGHVIPDRGAPAGHQPPWMVMDGADVGSLWSGAMLPAAHKPHSRDPAQGYLVTANNDPFGFTADGRVDDDAWYYGAFFEPGFRAGRIDAELARLVARGDVTVEDMQALQMDAQSALAGPLRPVLSAAVASIETDEALAAFRGRPELVELAARLAAWDGEMRRDSADALAWHLFAGFLCERVLREELGIFFEPAMDLATVFVLKIAARTVLLAYPGAEVLMPEGRDVLLVSALSDAAGVLAALPPDTTWGDVHGVSFMNVWAGGLLDRPFVSADGDEDTVNVSASLFFGADGVNPQFHGKHGALFRLVASYGDDGRPEAWINMAMGQSGDPASAHFDDLLGDWIDGGYRKLLFRRAEVDAAMESRAVLPKGMR